MYITTFTPILYLFQWLSGSRCRFALQQLREKCLCMCRCHGGLLKPSLKHVSEGWYEQCVFPNHVKTLAFKLYDSNRFGHVVGGLRWCSNWFENRWQLSNKHLYLFDVSMRTLGVSLSQKSFFFPFLDPLSLLWSLFLLCYFGASYWQILLSFLS